MNGENTKGKKKLTTFDVIDLDEVFNFAKDNQIAAIIVNTEEGRKLLVVSSKGKCDPDPDITSDAQPNTASDKHSERWNLVKSVESFAYVDQCGGCPAGQKCQLAYEDGYLVWACR